MSKERAVEIEKMELEAQQSKKNARPRGELKAFRQGVGKYLNLGESSESAAKPSQEPPAKKKKNTTYDFQNFNSW